MQLRAAQSTMAALGGQRLQSPAWSCKRSASGPRLEPRRSSFLTSWCGAKATLFAAMLPATSLSLRLFYTALCKELTQEHLSCCPCCQTCVVTLWHL